MRNGCLRNVAGRKELDKLTMASVSFHVSFGSRATIAAATADFCSSIRKRSCKGTQASRSPPDLAIPDVRCQHPERCHEDPPVPAPAAPVLRPSFAGLPTRAGSTH
jgi:hypothetical protein